MIAFAYFCSNNDGIRYMRQSIFTLLVLAGSMMPLTVLSGDIPDTVQIHGFASQGLISTNHNNFFGPSEHGVSSKFTELGANLSYRPHPDLQFSAQAISRRAGETDSGNVRLDYGFIDYAVSANESGRWGVMFGKTKNPFGLYNTTRDVAFTRPSILLPQSIYFDRARNFALSAPGMSFYGEQSSEQTDVYMQFGLLKPDVGRGSLENVFLGADRLGQLDGEVSSIGRILFERDGGRVRLAITGGNINMKYLPGTPDVLSAGNVTFNPWVLSAQYNAERWTLTSEYGLETVAIRGFGPTFPDLNNTSEHFYLQGTYRFSPKWEGLLRYDTLYLDKNDRDGSKYAALPPGTNLAHDRFARDWTIGLRYDVTPSFMLRGEFHKIDGTGWLPFEDNPSPNSTVQRWNMFLLQASYRF